MFHCTEFVFIPRFVLKTGSKKICIAYRLRNPNCWCSIARVTNFKIFVLTLSYVYLQIRFPDHLLPKAGTSEIKVEAW
jgi:hypothetical protein